MKRCKKQFETPSEDWQRIKAQPGKFNGYSDFRYGEKKPISLAKISHPIHSKGKRDHLVNQAVELLRDVRFSLWQNEAPVHHGLRTAMILNGNGWQRAEDEAAAIVRKAFNRLGRGVERRPSDDQARDEYFIPVENCLVCYRPLDDQSIVMRLRYCSPNHAKFAYEKRAYAEGAYNSEYGQAAYKMLYRERFKDQTCANPKCKHPIFKPYSEDQRFCKPACLYESQVIDYPDRVCALDGCDVVFKPTAKNPDQTFCCQSHATASLATVPLQQCALDGCEHWFKPKHKQKEGTNGGLYCCRECADKARSTRAYDLECQLCGDPFEAAMPNAVTCCNGHYQILRKFEKGTPPKRVSPPVFDFVFRPTRSPIMALFDAA